MSVRLFAALLPVSFALAQPALADDALKPFPEAAPGMLRHVLKLAEVPDPDAFRVEILAGRTVAADCNLKRYGATITMQDVPGWGYTYYTVSPLQGPASTMMACPPEHRERRFVAARFGDNALLRYNPRLPLVIYAPADVEVKYRVWQAGALQDAP